jgi:hypothetical protein
MSVSKACARRRLREIPRLGGMGHAFQTLGAKYLAAGLDARR